MKVILGADPLLMHLTGIGRYTKNLGNGLLRHNQIEQLLLFAHGNFFPLNLLDPDEELKKANMLAILRSKLAKSTSVVRLYQKVMPYFTQRALENYSGCIFHSPNFSIPRFKGKIVATIHDLSTIHFPEYHPAARVNFVNNAIEYTVKYADHIIVDSKFVKKEIIELLGGNERKITAIPLGADDAFFLHNPSQCQLALEQYSLVYKEYFLFVSTLEPRKNVVNILDAFCLYREKFPEGYPLILVGSSGWNNQEIMTKVNYLKEKQWVNYLGFISQNNLPALYSGAKALLFPSIYEGFGLPALEAMQSGTPVLTCKNSSMFEITKENAALVEANDVEAIAMQIEKFYLNREWCSKLSLLGVEKAKDFSWQKCISETVNVYKSLGVNS